MAKLEWKSSNLVYFCFFTKIKVSFIAFSLMSSLFRKDIWQHLAMHGLIAFSDIVNLFGSWLASCTFYNLMKCWTIIELTLILGNTFFSNYVLRLGGKFGWGLKLEKYIIFHSMYMSILLFQDDISYCSDSCPYDRLKLLDGMEERFARGSGAETSPVL